MLIDPLIALGAAASAGVVGSVHCAAMCGPLALVGSSERGQVRARAVARYAGGRFLGYAAVGALMGFLGQHALCLLPVSTAQTVAVIVVAGLAAARGIMLLVPRRRAARPVVVRARAPRPPLLGRVLAHLPRRGLGLGLVTAILPCGMLLPAWALAAGTGSAAWGAAVMLVFAAASMPLLLLPVLGGRGLARFSARVPAWLPGAAWCALALWVAARAWLGHAHHHGM